MDYDIVIATRNRADALRLSIPRMLGQGRLPGALIVVDSSDDHAAIATAVREACAGWDGRLEVIHSQPGLPHQRNVGLERVEAPVVFYPDDDSIWWPGTAEAIMRAYESDTAGEVAAVCAAEARLPPPGFDGASDGAYEMTLEHKFALRVGHFRARWEARLFPDPFHIHGSSQQQGRTVPTQLLDQNVVVVPWMTGFRMSFRTEVIRKYGFDEGFAGYALFEDVDASFSVLQQGLLIGARDAQVYHHRAPAGRGSERRRGATQVLNRAYVIAKHAAPGSVARQRLGRYGWYKLLQYLLRTTSGLGRERFAGALAAQRQVPKLLAAARDELPGAYQRALQACLNEQ